MVPKVIEKLISTHKRKRR